MDSSNNEYYKKLNQQIVAKDNLIRMLQMRLKKGEGKEESADPKLLNELEDARTRIEELQEENSSLQRDVDLLQNSIPESGSFASTGSFMGADSGETENENVSRLEIECENLHDQKAHLKREVERLEDQLSSKIAHIDLLKAEIRGEKEKQKELETSLLEGKGGASVKQEIIVATGDDFIRLVRNKIDEFITQGERVDEVRNILQEIETMLKSDLKRRDEELGNLRGRQDVNQALKEENDGLRSRVEKMRRELEDVQTDQNLSETVATDQDLIPLLYSVIQLLDEFEEVEKLDSAVDSREYAQRMKRIGTAATRLSRELKIETIDTFGEQFDERFHQVGEYIRNPEEKENVILGEMNRGYRQGNRIIRTALVKVVKNQHTCRNCGNKVRLGSSFCDTCGTRLEAMEVPVGELRNSSEMYFNTGQIYEDKGLLDKALEYYNQAVAQDATNARYQLSLGRVLEKNGLLNDAYEVFTKIPESDLLYDEARRYSRNINLKQAIIENLNNIGNF